MMNSKSYLLKSGAALLVLAFAAACGKPSTTAGSAKGPVDLGAAGNYVILAQSEITNTGTSDVTGDIAVNPAAASYIKGFALNADPTNVFSKSSQVTGNVYAADYAPPTPANLTTAVNDMELALTDAAGRAPDVTELGAGDISGMTLAPKVYKWSTGLLITTDVTLSGSATGVWIFQIAQNLTMDGTTPWSSPRRSRART